MKSPIVSTTTQLTQAHDDRVAHQIRATYPGMAHFAGSGPPWRTCRECEQWNPSADMSAKWRRDRDTGELKARRCRRFTALARGLEGPGVPHDAAACRHFEEATTHKPRQAIIERKRKPAEEH